MPESAGRKARRHGAKAAQRGILNKYVAIYTGIERGGKVVAQSVNRAKPSGEDLKKVFCGTYSQRLSVPDRRAAELSCP